MWVPLVAQLVKNPPANAGDMGSIPRLGRSGERNGNPLHSCLENSMDKGTHGVTKGWIRQNMHAPPCIFENDLDLSCILTDCVWSSRSLSISCHNFEPFFSGFCCLLAIRSSDALPVPDPLFITITSLCLSSSLKST